MNRTQEVQQELANFLAEVKKLPNGGVDPKTGDIVNEDLRRMQHRLLIKYIENKHHFTGISGKKLISSLVPDSAARSPFCINAAL